MKSANSVAVLYHKSCLDGFISCWVAWKKLGNKADYFPVDPREFPDSISNYKTIYAIDTSFFEKDLIKLRKGGAKIVVIDHHVSSKADIEKADDFRYDLKKSGTTLAWSYFFEGKKMPEFLKRIEDIDLWNFKFTDSKALDAYCELISYGDLKRIDAVIKRFEVAKTRKQIIAEGRLILEHQDHLVDRLKKNAEDVKFEKITTKAVNSPLFNSFIGADLYKEFPPIAIIWYEKEGRRFVSLRSNGTVDVSKIAKKYGGGGHARAAGFSMSASESLPWKRIKIATKNGK